MKTLLPVMLLSGLLVGCVPAPLRSQPGSQLVLETQLTPPPLTVATGEGGMYRSPGPAALRVRSDRAASVTAVVVPQGGRARVVPGGTVQAGVVTSVPLPASQGFTQVFTVASVRPLDLTAAEGARSLDAVARVVETAAATLPAGGYTVTTTVYRVTGLGTLQVSASVPGAAVRVNGRLAGTTPLTVPDVPEGPVTVEVSRAGFMTVSQRFNVQADTVAGISAVLRPITGSLKVDSDVPARVLIGGQDAGLTPLEVRVRPGTVNVNVVPLAEGLRTETLLVRVRVSKQTVVACQVTGGEFLCSVD
ncbi:PEGA domain-containing protein [Deinococcus aerophilus]|nr:PEGA domain-containing protein [Deinococcus aerophilus]